MKTEPNEPIGFGSYEAVESARGISEGLTKREYFAAMAMQGLCASGANDFNCDHVKHIANIAVTQADALINALNK